MCIRDRELTELYRGTDYLLDEGPELEDVQLKALQTARTKIEYTVPDLTDRLEQGQEQEPDVYKRQPYGRSHAEKRSHVSSGVASGMRKPYCKPGFFVRRATSRPDGTARPLGANT